MNDFINLQRDMADDYRGAVSSNKPLIDSSGIYTNHVAEEFMQERFNGWNNSQTLIEGVGGKDPNTYKSELPIGLLIGYLMRLKEGLFVFVNGNEWIEVTPSQQLGIINTYLNRDVYYYLTKDGKANVTKHDIGIMSWIDNQMYYSVDMPNHEAEAFGDFLLADYEIDAFDNGQLCWKLGGTNQKYTSKELFKEFKDIYRNRQGTLTVNTH